MAIRKIESMMLAFLLVNPSNCPSFFPLILQVVRSGVDDFYLVTHALGPVRDIDWITRHAAGPAGSLSVEDISEQLAGGFEEESSVYCDFYYIYLILVLFFILSYFIFSFFAVYHNSSVHYGPQIARRPVCCDQE